MKEPAPRGAIENLHSGLGSGSGLYGLIGADPRMRKLYELIEKLARTRLTVLIQGASGTGKSLIAQVIHQVGDRCNRPFVEVSCGALTDTLLESELFGHVRGAFTGATTDSEGKFQAAHGGTLFLDEISTASPRLQAKLLRVLQSSQFERVGSNQTETVDARVILATNTDLAAEVAAGRFRLDLFYRVNVVTLDVPPLAQRRSDVAPLARHFLRKACRETHQTVDAIAPDALRLLEAYDWPGNVRELENVITRAVALSSGATIGVHDLPSSLHGESSAMVAPADTPLSLRHALAQPERAILEDALIANAWNRQATARQLGINRTTLYKKMKRLGLSDDSRRHAAQRKSKKPLSSASPNHPRSSFAGLAR